MICLIKIINNIGVGNIVLKINVKFVSNCKPKIYRTKFVFIQRGILILQIKFILILHINIMAPVSLRIADLNLSPKFLSFLLAISLCNCTFKRLHHGGWQFPTILIKVNRAFFASSTSFNCSSVGFCPLSIINVLLIIELLFCISIYLQQHYAQNQTFQCNKDHQKHMPPFQKKFFLC